MITASPAGRGSAGDLAAARRRARRVFAALALVCTILVSMALTANSSRAQAAVPTLPDGFRDTIALDGLTLPTAVRFAPDGQIFVAEKSGIIKRFTSLGDRNPIIVANLSTAVDDIIDRGLESLAIDPGWSSGRRYLYVTYSLDAAIGEQPPRWNDSCPNPPGIDDDGCVIGGRLSRLTIGPDGRMTSEQVMIEDWCQQYHSHSLGDIQFGPEGALYVSAGDGASYTFVDYGQAGDPPNPCGDPPTGYGRRNIGRGAEGGSLRSQDLETPGDPTTLDGSIIRIDPNTSAPWPQNANLIAGIGDTNAKRIIAYGVRNPFRMAFRPGTNELWFGEVGWNTWEEVNRLTTPNASPANFGWPCYEGNYRQPGYDTAGLALCDQLYAKGTHVRPAFTYAHGIRAVDGDTCSTTTGSSPTGIAFVANPNWPARYQGGLIWADYARSCLYFMAAGVNGQPDPTKVEMFEGNSPNPVDLQVGPGGDLFFCDIVHGAVHRISYGTDPVVGGVTLDTWASRPGSRLADIPTGAPSSSSNVVTDFEASATGNAHGSRLRARLTAPASGDYTFWLASDGDADLYLSTDLDPANRRPIATVRNGVPPGAWDSQPSQRSSPVALVGGTTYFIEAFAKHPGAADHLAVAWSSAAIPRQVVPSNVLAPTAAGCAGWCPDSNGTPPRLPVPTITAPSTPTAWAVGDVLQFSGRATDPVSGPMAPSTLKWNLIMHHCTAGASCHVHQVQTFNGVANGSFDTPTHDWPSYLELVLTATNADGYSGTTSIQLDPRPVEVTFAT